MSIEPAETDKFKVVSSVLPSHAAALKDRVSVPDSPKAGVVAEPFLEPEPNLAQLSAPPPWVKFHPSLSALSVFEAILPFQEPSLPPVPSQSAKVSSKTVIAAAFVLPSGAATVTLMVSVAGSLKVLVAVTVIVAVPTATGVMVMVVPSTLAVAIKSLEDSAVSVPS